MPMIVRPGWRATSTDQERDYRRARYARWSRAAFLRATTRLVLRTLYPAGLPDRLWWAAHTTSDKPSAKQVCGIRRGWRSCLRPGRPPQATGTAGCRWPTQAQGRQPEDGHAAA